MATIGSMATNGAFTLCKVVKYKPRMKEAFHKAFFARNAKFDRLTYKKIIER